MSLHTTPDVGRSADAPCWMAAPIHRPVVRWHGGKFRLAPWIVEHLPAHRIYCEPFGGAASVLLVKPRSKVEAYNDMDKDIVHLFGVLRDPAQAARLADACRLTPYSFDEWQQSWDPAPDPVERARRYVYRHWSSFGNGASGPTTTGFRRCLKGRTGNSHPALEWANWPDLVPALVERLRGVVIENRPALDVIDTYDTPDTCFYFDPPYVHSTRSRTDRQYRHELTDADHAALLDRAQHIQGAAVISGYDCPLYAEALRGWHRVTKAARTDKGGSAIEVLWINRVPQQTLFTERPSNSGLDGATPSNKVSGGGDQAGAT
jgi:DNA adenine methylase